MTDAYEEYCQACGSPYISCRPWQRCCCRKCAATLRAMKAHASPEYVGAVEVWRAKTVASAARRESWLLKKRFQRSVHADVLMKHGLSVDLAHAAHQLGISIGTLKQRIRRNPDNILKPLRRYGQRPVTVQLGTQFGKQLVTQYETF